jgi:hypothetical protein
MKLILNKTLIHTNRYTLITGTMGCVGEPANHANRKYEIAIGIDKGGGYQGYMAISYFMAQTYIPQALKDQVKAICDKENLIY